MATDENGVRLPNRFVYWLAAGLFRVYIRLGMRARVVRNTAKDVMKGQFVLICNHASIYDWIYVGAAIYPAQLNFVITRYYFANKVLGKLFGMMGAICKDQFVPDVSTVKNIMKAVKLGGDIMIFPEGRTSNCGETETIELSTVKLLRKLGLPVVNMHMNGAYLTRPKWAEDKRRGRVELTVDTLFTPEQLASSTDGELAAAMSAALYSNEYEWEKTAHVRYPSRKMAKGLHNILYICPKCGGMFTTETTGKIIRCGKCGNGAKLDHYYHLTPLKDSSVPATIAEWYMWQKDEELRRMESDPDFSFSGGVTMRMTGRGKGWFTDVGRGTLTADMTGTRYTGTKDGQPFELFAPAKTVSALPYGAGTSVEICLEHVLYGMIPENLQQCARFAILHELAHKLAVSD